MDLSSLDAVGVALRALPVMDRLEAVEPVLRWAQAEKEAALAAVAEAAGSDRAVCSAVAAVTGTSARGAERQLEEAGALAGVAPTLAALEAGEITRAAAVVTATTLEHLPPPLAADLAERVISEVRSTHGGAAQPRHFQQAAQRLAAEHTPDEVLNARHAAAHRRRGVELRALPEGMALISWTLRADRAQTVYDTLTARARKLVDRDARDEPGWDARRSDTLYALVLGAQTVGASPLATPKVVHWVHQPVEGPAFLDGGQVLPPRVAAELVAAAARKVVQVDAVGRVADPPPTHDPFDREVTPRLRTWVMLRDRTCRFPGCAVPARLCELDHLVAWAAGGLSTPANLACLCSAHHRGSKHSARWTVRPASSHGANEALLWAGPGGKRFETRPGVLSPPAASTEGDPDG